MLLSNPRVGFTRPVNYAVAPSNTELMSGDLVRQWRAMNRTQTLSPYLANTISVGSGALVDATQAAAYITTSTTLNSCAGVQFPKHTGCCPPGLGKYHYVYWPRPLFISFQFGIVTTLAVGSVIIGSYGSDNNASLQAYGDSGGGVLYKGSWVPTRSCVWFLIDSTGLISIGMCNAVAVTHSLTSTGVTMSVTGSTEPITHEILFAPDGTGNVHAFLDNVFLITITGMQTTQSGTDNYPFIGIFNGTIATQDMLVYPLEVTSKAY